MGDLADLYFDIAVEEELEYQHAIGIWMDYTPAELAQLTAMSRDPKIMSIRKLVLEGKPISHKQKRVLATWLAEASQ